MEANYSVFGNIIAHKQLKSIFNFNSIFWIYLFCSKLKGTKTIIFKEKFSEFAVCFSYPTSPLKDMKRFNR